MPRFPEESTACLKRVMLARSPDYLFTADDVEVVMKETGLIKAQILVWTDNFRFRFGSKSVDETLDFLRSTEKVTSQFLGPKMFSGPSHFS